MLIISNHVKNKLNLSKEVIIRINMAWLHSYENLVDIIEGISLNKIFLDFPQGRNKPPKPTLTFEDALKVMEKYENILYYATSNAESPEYFKKLRTIIPQHITIVPKIETTIGVTKVLEIVEACNTNTVMLDKEDLYVSVFNNSEKFFDLVNEVRNKCKDINLLELSGVVFCEYTK